MQLNPKKILGDWGRRHGGKRFNKLKDTYHSCRRSVLRGKKQSKDWIATFFVSLGRPAPWSLDKEVDAKFYHDREEKLAKPGVIVILDGAIHHGGLTDRLRGILTAYRECRRLNIPFYIYWDNPFQLTDYLLPATIDWRISKEEISRSRRNSRAVVIDDMTDRESLRRLRAALKKRPPQLHLYTNADSARGEYEHLYAELFTPTPRLKEAVGKHKEILGKDYVSLTCRFLTLLGDFDDWLKVVLSEEEQTALIEKVKNEIRELMKRHPENTRFHITSDSRKFLAAVQTLDPRIYIVEGDIRNIDLNRQGKDNAWFKTFVDQNLLMGAKTVYRLRTGSMYPTGFAPFAAEVGGARFIDHMF